MFVILLAAVFVAAVLLIVSQYVGGQKLPPGPRGLPLVGNIFQVDSLDNRKTFARWHQQYGPVVRLKLGWSDVIILGTIPATKDLFGKKGARYGSRPEMTMAREVMTKNMQTSTLPYGDKWKNSQPHSSVTFEFPNVAKLSEVGADGESTGTLSFAERRGYGAVLQAVPVQHHLYPCLCKGPRKL